MLPHLLAGTLKPNSISLLHPLQTRAYKYIYIVLDDDDYDDRDRDRDRHDDRRRPSRRDRESSGGMLPKVKPKEMLEKGKKGWETAKPVAGPLLGTLAKAYLEKGH